MTERSAAEPPTVELPPSARKVELDTDRGPITAIQAEPRDQHGAPTDSASAAPAAGSTVVLVPGYTGSKEDFLPLLEPLTEAGYRVVALDLRGQCAAPRAQDPAAYDIEALAKDVTGIARGLGAPVDLVGHSFGGLVARAAVLDEPEAFRSLTLLCSGPAALPAPRSKTARMLVDALSTLDLPTIWIAKQQLEAQAGAVPPSPEAEEFGRRRFLVNCPVGLRRMGEQLLSEPDRVQELAGLGLPVHVVYGQYDDAWPPTLQAQMARRLGAREAVLPGLGHSPAAEDPQATAAVLIAFWADLAASPPAVPSSTARDPSPRDQEVSVATRRTR